MSYIKYKHYFVTVTVQIVAPPAITPKVRYIKPGESRTFSMIGGMPPYTATILTGEGEIQNGEMLQSSIIIGSFPGDLDKNAIIDADEANLCFERFFAGETLGGVNMDKSQLYRHIEAFISEK